MFNKSYAPQFKKENFFDLFYVIKNRVHNVNLIYYPFLSISFYDFSYKMYSTENHSQKWSSTKSLSDNHIASEKEFNKSSKFQYFGKSCKQPSSIRCAPIAFVRHLNASEQRCLDKFINLCMRNGKKNKSYKIINNTLYKLQSHGDVINFLMKAVENVKPVIEVKKVRIAGSTQLVPSIIPKNRQERLAIRWLLEAALRRRLSKKNLPLDQCLFAELLDAYNQIGTVRKKRDDLHKLAESNRGFAHYRWW